jgi:hypothetical protein
VVGLVQSGASTECGRRNTGANSPTCKAHETHIREHGVRATPRTHSVPHLLTRSLTHLLTPNTQMDTQTPRLTVRGLSFTATLRFDCSWGVVTLAPSAALSWASSTTELSS